MISADNLTQEHLIAGVQWISKMSAPERWNLTDEEVAYLLGIETVTFQEMQLKALDGQPIVLGSDALERLSLLLGVWKGLNLFLPHQRQDLAFDWFSKPTTCPSLNHQSIKHFLLESNSVESFQAVITYLRAQH